MTKSANHILFSLAHQHALELLIELLANHKKTTASKPFLEQIVANLDSYFGMRTFANLYAEKLLYYEHNVAGDDDSLFLQSFHKPFLLREQILIELSDKLQAYLIILGWTNQFKIPFQDIVLKLAAQLELPSMLADKTKDFVFSPSTMFQNNFYLKLVPEGNDATEQLEGDWVDSNKPEEIKTEEKLIIKDIKYPIEAFYLVELNAFLLSAENVSGTLRKNNLVFPGPYFLLQLEDSLHTPENIEINFSILKEKLIEKIFENRFFLFADNVAIHIKENYSIKAFSMLACPGQLIGVVGKEGSGKTTLLRMLAGYQKPGFGAIYLNAFNIFKNKYQLAGIMGYVPEEDFLFEELTVIENIELTARLHLGNSSYAERKELVGRVLSDLRLTAIQHLVVGSIEEKILQPGQRRLVNIALELIRQPEILIVDNARSGLSISDATLVVECLSSLTFRGMLIITSITQTSPEVFVNFDSLFVLGDQGYPLFYGPRHKTLAHFVQYIPKGIRPRYNQKYHFISNDILEVIELRPQKLRSELNLELPAEKVMYDDFKKNEPKDIFFRKQKNILPAIKFPTARLEQQYRSYSLRIFKIKLARRKELVFTILAAPILAFFYSILLRQDFTGAYQFSENKNIPGYFYLSILTCLFLGLIQTALEIIQERKILIKEDHLNLSMFSYINAKLTYHLLLILLQTFLFTVLGNSILQIKGMLFYHWMVYFGVAASGVFAGLFISATHTSTRFVFYKTIPLFILFCLLLGGGWLPLDKIKRQQKKYPPLVAELSVSKWAYEAIMVQQFAANPYEKHFFKADKNIRNGAFQAQQVLPYLESKLNYVGRYPKLKTDTIRHMLFAIQKQFEFYEQTEDIFPFEYTRELNMQPTSMVILSETAEYLDYLVYHFARTFQNGIFQKQTIADSLQNLFGTQYIEQLEKKHQNNKVKESVLNSHAEIAFEVQKGMLYQYSDPVFQNPGNNFGRAQMFQAEKMFNGQVISTFEFNLSVIWSLNLFIYLLLITKIPTRLAWSMQ